MERRPHPIEASERSDSRRSDSVDARTSLAVWLRAGRAHRGMSLDHVARVTKIQPRILERLEAGKLDGLPADVFVRGFVRSFARCVGLDECEALRRYAACAVGPQDLAPTVRALVDAMSELAPGSATTARATPRKMQAVEVIDLAGPVGSVVLAAPAPGDPGALVEARDAVAVAAVEPPAASTAPALSKKKRGRRRKARAAAVAEAAGISRAPLAMGTPPTASPIVAAPRSAAEVSDAGDAPRSCDRYDGPESCEGSRSCESSGPESADTAAARASASASAARGSASASAAPASASAAPAIADAPVALDPAAASVVDHAGDAAAVAASAEPVAPWSPKLPPLAAPVPSGVPWRRSARRLASGSLLPGTVSAASLAPSGSSAVMRSQPSLVIDDADPESAERMLEERAENLAPRRSFLPPILLDREDRSARQGGLTLAVILLLIAATLTLSYLMRRPSASGDGMTAREAPAQLG
jgi:hypothetical protein